jgi:hypothetical protein
MVLNGRVILTAIAVFCFLLSAIGASTWKWGREEFLATGLALWALASLV